ncbi:hypothetical protein DEJ50_21995 [Streptomyces venezuelae]|uniref:Uncharacterized protein n=1 Tax=Streptomyces venezuelae TaxID=54571 RepID=A0A5P2D6D4_STRVZ|nr:hypothetical protein DEJ50_21995 [Streptomyces venezuelae]
MTGHDQHQRQHQHQHLTVAPQAGREQRVCPACGRPVETVIRRRKVLGAFVPEWGPGPCRNPDCTAREPDDVP